MTDELAVWLFADCVGTLAQSEGRLTFRYAPGWLRNPDAIALSCSLPLQGEPFDDQKTRPFFAGLLPEGQLRDLIAQQLHVSGRNDFALLDRLGGECAGAVTLMQPGQSPAHPATADEVRWLGDDDVITLLDELPRRPMLAGEDGLRLSLAGAQDKLPVVFRDGRIGLPLNGAPSTHILKPPIHSLAESVMNEGFCLALAEVAQLEPARGFIHSVKGSRFLLLERYDRVDEAAGRVQRLHQEDFCQALGMPTEMKYQNESGPGLAQCFGLVRRMTRPSAPQVLRLLDYVIFNLLIGNNDAHAKNFSLLYRGKVPVLAPLYDTLSTAVYPNLMSKMAMKIGSKYSFSEVQARHWDQFAENVGLSPAQTRKRVRELAGLLPGLARTLHMEPGNDFSGNGLVEQIVKVLEQRAALTIERL